MSILSIVIAFSLLLSIGAVWFLLYYFGNPVINEPDGIAKVVGNCGDTMEIGLCIKAGKIHDAHHWTNGCSSSKHCVETAANLALGKSLEEVRKINIISIIEEVGRLPDTHLHCAQLAEITLQKSVDNYFENEKQEIHTINNE